MKFIVIALMFWGCAVNTTENKLSLLAPTASEDYMETLAQHRAKLVEQYKDKESSPFIHKKDRKQFEQLNFFAPDLSYKVVATVESIEEGPIIEFPTSAGTIKKYQEQAYLHFEIGNAKHMLTIYKNTTFNPAYPNHLFLPFTDLTSGGDCYGGGRYIDMEGPLGETVEIDFNYAYNPYCAYSDGWFCPIPPANNFIDSRIEAGEKVYWTDDKH